MGKAKQKSRRPGPHAPPPAEARVHPIGSFACGARPWTPYVGRYGLRPLSCTRRANSTEGGEFLVVTIRWSALPALWQPLPCPAELLSGAAIRPFLVQRTTRPARRMPCYKERDYFPPPHGEGLGVGGRTQGHGLLHADHPNPYPPLQKAEIGDVPLLPTPPPPRSDGARRGTSAPLRGSAGRCGRKRAPAARAGAAAAR